VTSDLIAHFLIERPMNRVFFNTVLRNLRRELGFRATAVRTMGFHICRDDGPARAVILHNDIAARR
jgi:hypothetical protein